MGHNKRPLFWLETQNRRFEVLQELSLPTRGRWLVRDPQPKPNGTCYTAIVQPDSEDARQLEKAIRRLPRGVSGLPHLVATGWHNNRRVLVITWEEGPTLRDYLNRCRDGKLRLPSVLETVRRMKSLAFLLAILNEHCQLGHGDIKPENLVLPRNPGAISLIDFGSSWLFESTVNRLPGDGLTDDYSAPERLEPQARIDNRADQFSVAVVMYEMLTGKIPFEGLGGKAGTREFRHQCEGTLELPSSCLRVSAGAPKKILAQIDNLIGRALNFSANDRFESPRRFAREFSDILTRMRTNDDRTASKRLLARDSPLQWLLRFFRK